MKFFTYEDVPLFLGVSGRSGEYIFAEQASINVQQSLKPTRYSDDTRIRFTDNANSHPIGAGSTENWVLGPSGGPPQPLSTSIYKIPSGTKITFPNNKNLFFEEDIYPNGHNYTAELRSYSGFELSNPESQSGYFEPIWRYAAKTAIGGNMNVSFYVNSGNLPNFFNITGLSNPATYPPIDEERITGFLGNFRFDNAYLKTFSFSLSPNSISRANASFEIYGTLTEDTSLIPNYYSSSLYQQQSVPHGMGSEVVGTTDHGISHLTNFSYNMQVNRLAKFPLGTGDRTSSQGLIPTRVAKLNTTINMSLQGESINPNIFSDEFGGKRANITVNLKDLNYSNFEDNSQGLMGTLKCSGVVSDQSLQMNNEGYLKGSLSIKQDLM
jgi:hypothetical protein